MPIVTPHPKLPDPAHFEREGHQFLKAFRFNGLNPSLKHICAISHYFSRLPYENISKIIKFGQQGNTQAFRLPDELTEDHFTWHLGGTCFSLTYFLTGIYTLLDYTAKPLICNLNWGANNHSAVIVTFHDRQFLIDPGYMIFTPLPLIHKTVRTQISADTGLELRFFPETNTYSLYTFRKGQFTCRYHFTNKEISYSAFAKHWQASFQLPGMDNLTLTQVQGYEMTYIQGDFIKITSPTRSEKIRAGNQVENLILHRFGIPLEKVEEARYIIQARNK